MKTKRKSTESSSSVSRALRNCALRLRWIFLLVLFSYLMGLGVMNWNLYHHGTQTSDSASDSMPHLMFNMNQRVATAIDNDPSNTQPQEQVAVVESTHPDFPREPVPRPPLESIVQGWNITGDVSWLLNLAIIGFPKTGTSTLMHYLHKSPQIHVFDEERCEIEYNQHARLIQSLYRDIPPGNFIRGIKCPRDLEVSIALKNYQTFFPKTDFMVGLRHPIEWFESFYNFRINNFFTMPPAETLIGRCTKRTQGVCTFRGNFHLFLANMGKTNIANNPQEQLLIPEEYRKAIKPFPLQGRIFLWEMTQLKNDDHHIFDNSTTATNSAGVLRHSNVQFRSDLQHFLRLEHALPEMIWVKPGFAHVNETIKAHITSQKIDICNDQYEQLRAVLLHQGTLAAHWIRDYFLHADGVFVSQKEYFSQVILKRWERDPCLDRRAAASSVTETRA